MSHYVVNTNHPSIQESKEVLFLLKASSHESCLGLSAWPISIWNPSLQPRHWHCPGSGTSIPMIWTWYDMYISDMIWTSYDMDLIWYEPYMIWIWYYMNLIWLVWYDMLWSWPETLPYSHDTDIWSLSNWNWFSFLQNRCFEDILPFRW